MIVTWVSKEGGREYNEDAVGKTRKKGIVCVVVADGLGGHAGGSLASKLAVDTVLDEFTNDPGFSKEHIEKYINVANDAIVSRAMNDPELLYMSSTLVVLLIKGRRAIWANVGDSRMYRLCEGIVAEVSEDHSVAFLDFVNGVTEYSDIRTSPNQNKLTSALGVVMDGMNISEKIHINASTSFLLCTDGFWEYVTEEDMENTFKDSDDGEGWLEKMIAIREAKAPPNSDNYTAAVIVI